MAEDSSLVHFERFSLCQCSAALKGSGRAHGENGEAKEAVAAAKGSASSPGLSRS